MKLSQVPVNAFCKWDKLFIFKINERESVFVLDGTEIKKGEPPIDLPVEPSTKVEFLDALKKVDHKGDWYSMMLGEMVVDTINKL
jgi:hypothetical protein